MHGELRRVVDRFLAGVLLDDTGATSTAFSLLLARMFVRGVPGLPAEGMRALPHQLAAPLRSRIALNHRATHVEHDGKRWTVRGPDAAVSATEVVVATDPATAAALTGQSAPPMHGVVTDWWAADEAPSTLPMLWVDGRPNPPGPVVNTAVISAAAPTYAPPGRHLISASALLANDGTAPPESVTRRHAADILGADGTGWELLTRNEIRDALPAQPPPLRVRRPVRVARRIVVVWRSPGYRLHPGGAGQRAPHRGTHFCGSAGAQLPTGKHGRSCRASCAARRRVLCLPRPRVDAGVCGKGRQWQTRHRSG